MSVGMYEALEVLASGIEKLMGVEDLSYTGPTEAAVAAELAIILDGSFEAWSTVVDKVSRKNDTPSRSYVETDQSTALNGKEALVLIIKRADASEPALLVRPRTDQGSLISPTSGAPKESTIWTGLYPAVAYVDLVIDMTAHQILDCSLFVGGEIDGKGTAWLAERLGSCATGRIN